MSVQAQAADGTIHEFPDGTDPSVVDRVMKDYATKNPTSPDAYNQPRDIGIPGGPNDPAKNYKPTPAPSPMAHIGSVLEQSFEGPYGPSDATVAPFVGHLPVLSTVNRALLQGGGAALDALGRPLVAAARGGSAAVSEASKLLGNTDPEGLERDLNTGADVAMLEAGQAASIPKLSSNVGGAATTAARAAGQIAKAPAAKALNWFWDVDKFAKQNPEKIALIEKGEAAGARFPIGAWAPGAPYWSRMLQIAKGWNIDPVKEAGVPFYETQAGKVMEAAGLPHPAGEGLTTATSAVPLTPAGEAVVARATKTIDDATAALNSKVQGFKATTLGPVKEQARERARSISQEQQALIAEADAARATAREAVRAGFEDINATMDRALTADQAQSGAVMAEAEQKLRALRRSVGAHFRQLYDAADQAAEGHAPNVEGLGTWAKQMLDGMLQPVKDQFPREIKTLTDLASKEDQAPKQVPTGLVDASGQPIMRFEESPAIEPVTFGRLHELRSWVRYSIDWDDLAPGPAQGARKQLETMINDALHDQEASPELRAAAKMLDAADAEYRQVIPRFRDTVIRQIVNSGAAAAPDNAAKLAALVITEGNTSRIAMVRDMVGPDIWRKVLAADLRSITAHSMDASGRFDAQAFARKIIERDSLGMLAPAFGKDQAAALVTQAKRIQQTYGKFDIDVLPGDTVTTLMQRAENAEARAEALAESNPMEMLAQFSKHIDSVAQRMLAEGKEAIKGDIIHDLVGLPAEKAVDKIFRSPDLFRAVTDRFGPDSNEVTLLRQAWVRKFLQRPFEKTSTLADEFGENTEEIQRILFPGSSLNDMLELTKQMNMMLPKSQDATALGMAGQSMLQNPANSSFFPHLVRRVLLGFPTGVARGVASVALSKIANTLTDPALRRFIMNGSRGTEIQQDASRVALYSVMAGQPPRIALAAGAAVLAGQLHEEPEQPAPPVKIIPWRQRMNQSPGPAKGWRQRMQQGSANGP